MYIVFGASGQVGSAVVDHLVRLGKNVKAIVHSPEKEEKLRQQGIVTAVADANDKASLINAFKDGETLFIITPETGQSKDLIAETEQQLANHRAAIKASSIKKVVGLSSLGAHLGRGTGNLEMSYLLEHAFEGLPVKQVFIRPAYYFSNWLMGIDEVKESGILPTFFPVDQIIPMISPQDVAAIAADVLIEDNSDNAIYEIEGPSRYSSTDVAEALGNALQTTVKAQQIPRDEWDAALQKMELSPDGVKNFIKMTEIVVAGKTDPEGKGNISIKGDTTLDEFISQAVESPVTG